MQKTRSVAVCDMFRSPQNIAKTVVLLHEQHFCDACLLARKIIDKCGLEGSKTFPRPPKIKAGATQSPKKMTNMSKKTARGVQEPAKSEKKAPKIEKTANMVLPRARFTLEFGPPCLGPPLERKCSMLIQA